VCQGCVDSPPLFKSLCSITSYTPRAAGIIQKLKYRGCSRIARCLGAQLAIHVVSTSPHLLVKNPVIVPVPQTFKKTFKRGYNQAALLGKTFSRLTCIPFLPTGLKRVHEVSSMSGKPAKQRRRIIDGAFTINTLKGSRWNNIILLDDVATTLSTLNECTASIQGYFDEPREIWAVTIARSI
jgi:ComF family protein